MGMLDTSLHLTLDYELWLRITTRYPLYKIDVTLATSRMYRDNKTLSRRADTFREVFQITKKYRNYVPLNWIYGYAGHLLDGKDDFFEPSSPSVKKYALAFLARPALQPHATVQVPWRMLRRRGDSPGACCASERG